MRVKVNTWRGQHEIDLAELLRRHHRHPVTRVRPVINKTFTDQGHERFPYGNPTHPERRRHRIHGYGRPGWHFPVQDQRAKLVEDHRLVAAQRAPGQPRDQYRSTSRPRHAPDLNSRTLSPRFPEKSHLPLCPRSAQSGRPVDVRVASLGWQDAREEVPWIFGTTRCDGGSHTSPPPATRGNHPACPAPDPDCRAGSRNDFSTSGSSCSAARSPARAPPA